MTQRRNLSYNKSTKDNFTTVTPTRTTTTTTTSSSGTSSSTGARARSVEATVLHGWYVESCAYYEACFRRHVAPGIRRDIAETIRDGMTGECLNAIMDEAQTAPRPSWAYCMAIVRRCKNAGIMTLEDWQRDRQGRRSEVAYDDGDDFDVKFFELFGER